MKKNSGQSLIMFTLIIAALMAILISSLLISISNLDKEVDRLKVRVNSTQATIQFAQMVQKAWQIAIVDPTCITPGTRLVTTSSQSLCMPATVPCIAYRYCLSEAGNYEITAVDKISEEQYFVQDDVKKENKWSISWLPQASAQSEQVSTRPVLAAPPSSTVAIPVCPAAPPFGQCVVCAPAAGANADCYKIKICTNTSSNCTNRDHFYEAQVAVVKSK